MRKFRDKSARDNTYLHSAGATGTVTVSSDGTQLTVTVTGSYTTTFVPALGIGSMPVTGHATATLLHGVTAPDEEVGH
ncbi:hypothetical protein ACFYYI_17870 [Streptomyces sp. NPDC002387]|uniref:hypothetical protein n=1 Tax=Streptomyces sp. NPDC002387 TaxID=3364643 RepID=UPI0036C738E6